MHNNHVVKILGMITLVVTALAAIIVGLIPLGYDFFKLPFIQNNMPQLVTPTYYIIGAAGVISLLLFLMSLASGGCMCGCSEHNKQHRSH